MQINRFQVVDVTMPVGWIKVNNPDNTIYFIWDVKKVEWVSFPPYNKGTGCENRAYEWVDELNLADRLKDLI